MVMRMPSLAGRPHWASALLVAGLLLPIRAQTPASASGTSWPFSLQRFQRPGPVAGVVARVDLGDPRVAVKVVLADAEPSTPAAPDCAGRLDAPSAVARKHGLALALNGSFFKVPPRPAGDLRGPYVTGNCGTPVGWHLSQGPTRTRPSVPRMEGALVVHASGQVTLHAHLDQLPADARQAVGGNALVLAGGRPAETARDTARHPRSAVGLDATGRTLLLVAVDGRQEGHSRGATLAELADLMKDLGAWDALNLDGGGSTALVVRDRASGAVAVANRPSTRGADLPDLPLERPVVDVLGVTVRDPAPAPRPTPLP